MATAKVTSTLRIDPELLTRVEGQVGKGKRFTSKNDFYVEAIKEKLEREK